MDEGDDISEDDLRELEQILIYFHQISDLFSSINFKSKGEAQRSYQAIHFATLILRDILSNSFLRFCLSNLRSRSSDLNRLTRYSRTISSWINVVEGDFLLFDIV
jgi:hypothetical protein